MAFFKKLVNAVEDVAKVDLDGDGKKGSGGGGGGGGGGARDATSDKAPDAVLQSSCNGNKRSLFIGINYVGQKGELRGCHNDVDNIKAFVTSKFGFGSDAAHCRVLLDKPGAEQPTRANMMAGFRWLVDGAKSGDSLFLHYSGHGGTAKDVAPDTDEADHQDETLCPVDYHSAGVIVDDELHELLVASLPAGVRLTCVFDCCHSGSVLDLAYTYTIDGALVVHETDNYKEVMEACVKAGVAYYTGDKKRAMAEGMNVFSKLLKAQSGGGAADNDAQKRAVLVRATKADAFTFSGCRDEQTSADANIGGEATGAASWALIKAWKEHGLHQTYTELLGNMRGYLSGKFSQVPQLSAGRHVDVKQPFAM